MRTAAICILAALGGCGGGGSSGGGSAPPPSPPVLLGATNPNASTAAFFGSTKTYALTGTTAAGGAISASLAVAPTSAVTYSGKTYDRRIVTTSVTVGAAAPTVQSTTFWFQQGTIKLAFLANSDGNCALVNAATDIPATAARGDVGTYATATYHIGCSALGQSVFGSDGAQALSWAFKAYGATTFVCLTSTLTRLGVTSQENCIEVVDAAGTLGSKARVTSTDASNVTTTLTN